MDPDQTDPLGAVWSGFIVFVSMIKSSFKSTWMYVAEIFKKSRRYFQDKNIGRIRVNIQYFMGKSFQDYSWIHDFEADFPQKVSLKMLN